MHTDARQIDNGSIIEGDICIIGAGATGLSMAIDWDNTPYKVILLEGGGFDYDDKVQELYNGKILGDTYYPMKSSRLHYFGGSTGHWGGMCSTFDEIDFEKRDWVENSGWPIKLNDITPFYPRVHNILDLGPNEWDVKYWQEQYSTFTGLPFDEKVIWNKMWQFSPPTRFGSKYKNAIVNSKNIQLYTYANVTDITATDNVGAISQVTIKNYAGKQHTVKARYFILACCSIQNSRLLLASNKQATKGLGNDTDNVGRYFMEHPHYESGELWLKDSNPLELYKMEGQKPRAELAISREKQQELKILNATIGLMPLELSKNKISNIKMWAYDDPRKSLDSAHKYSTYDKRNFFERHFMNSKLYKAYGFITGIEQAPNPSSRVVIGDEVDELGVPRANLIWKMMPIDKRTVLKITETLGEQAGIAGIGRVRIAEFLLDETSDLIPPSYVSGSWHHIGTTRMSDDAKTGVVDKNCKVHGISNLFVTGASCFPTSGAINPTFTAIAISLRLSDHLKEQIKTSVVPSV